MTSERIVEPHLLQAGFKDRLEELLGTLAYEAIPIQLFETIRSPARQEYLHGIGRDPTKPEYGRTVTRAEAYGSAHQYGLGSDLVFHVNGLWTWKEPERGMWARYHELAQACSLETLSFEEPHVQWPGFQHRLATLPRGPTATGDWLTWLGETDVLAGAA